MSAARDLQTLLDQVSETAGWRVVDGGSGYKIFPANPQQPMFTLHTTSSGKERQLEELRQRLRRADFPFPNGNSLPVTKTPFKEPRMVTTTSAPAPANGHAATAERTAFQQASDCIHRIIGDLTTLETLLKKIEAEGQDWQKAKASLAVLLGR